MPPAALPGAKLLNSLTNGYGKRLIFLKPKNYLSRFLKSGPPEGPPEALSLNGTEASRYSVNIGKLPFN